MEPRLPRQSTPVTAIETKYKGYRFRSRLEAKYAVMFDTLGIDWVYENQGYWLNMRTGRLGFERQIGYLPDFFLPEFRMHIEIKPGWNQAVDAGPILSAFREQVGPIMLMVDMPTVITECRFSGRWNGCSAFLGVRRDGKEVRKHGFWGFLGVDPFERRRLVLKTFKMANYGVDPDLCAFVGSCDGGTQEGGLEAFQHEPYPSAIEAARSARFEHGEQG